jgi:hypothetical protein
MKAERLFSCNAHADTTRFCSGRDAAFAMRLSLAQILKWPERDSVGRGIELQLQVYQQVWSWDYTIWEGGMYRVYRTVRYLN